MEIALPDIPMVKKYPRATLVILILFFILIAWLVESVETKSDEPSSPAELEGLDTYIPSGFVLVPIEIQNLASVDSILGQYGVVDLYTEGENSAVGRGLKLIRSPRDPSQFAVMVGENEESREIVKYSAKPFQIIVQNRQQTASEVRKSARTQRVHWED